MTWASVVEKRKLLFLFRITYKQRHLPNFYRQTKNNNRLYHQRKHLYYGLGMPSDVICSERGNWLKSIVEYQILRLMTRSSSLKLFPPKTLKCLSFSWLSSYLYDFFFSESLILWSVTVAATEMHCSDLLLWVGGWLTAPAEALCNPPPTLTPTLPLYWPGPLFIPAGCFVSGTPRRPG